MAPTVDTDRGYAQGNRVIAALIGSLVGGALIGWLIDRWFGTAPWGLIVAAVPRDSGRVQADHSDFQRTPGMTGRLSY